MYEHRGGLVLGCSDPKQMGLPFASEWIRSQGHYVKKAVVAAFLEHSIAKIHQVRMLLANCEKSFRNALCSDLSQTQSL